MGKGFVPQVGAVFSADIAVPEHERVVRFYTRVLCTGDAPLWREADLMNNAGIPIIGIGAASPAYGALPTQWMPHIQVADVAASAQRAAARGGTVLLQSEAGDPSGGWAVVQDPQGAAFGLVPVPSAEVMAQHGYAADSTPMGCIAWLDLTVRDADALRDFYQQVVGWSVQAEAMEDVDGAYADHVMLGADGTALAGVCHARGINRHLPPVWMLYLPVGDLDESVRRVEAEGGQLLAPVRGKGAQAYAFVQDPVGVVFAVMQG